ncbi:uncharacterized protein G2W53_037982 [Senna tora]|uniref:Uncharacterized protein n=1 Tax=Senna tora TaxID=362788 RepID=A0A834W4S5_9FABA|nr:uncharacterized protein G2W53_037982 [Senna tora]
MEVHSRIMQKYFLYLPQSILIAIGTGFLDAGSFGRQKYESS